MKKFIVIAASLLLMAFQANAQLKADGGYMHAFETHLDGNREPGYSNLDGFYTGIKYQFLLDNWVEGLGIAPGVNASFLFGREAGLKDGLENSTVSEIALNIPLHVTYQFEIASGLKFIAQAGPTFQFGLQHGAIDGTDNPRKIYNLYEMVPNNLENIAAGILDPIPARNRFNLYLGAGAGFELGDAFTVTLGYDFGLLNLSTGTNMKIHRGVFSVGLGYIF